MRFSLALATTALCAHAQQQLPEGMPSAQELMEIVERGEELPMETLELIYKTVTGPYCEENAETDPLCSHVKEERENWASSAEWIAPEFERPEAYCSRFPENCDNANRLEVNPETRFLIDSHGRTVLLHGVNAIYKVDPYIPSQGDFDPQNSLNDEDIANLKKWGMNFMRLGVMWEGVEREAGKYDMAYLDKVEALINKMGEAGIYTLVDAHQDVFARYLCGEGVPDFYAQKIVGKNPSCINPFVDRILKNFYDNRGYPCADMNDLGYRVDDNGDYLIEDCLQEMFANYYNTKQSVTAFGALFTNKHHMNDKFAAYWDATSARFAHNPYVIGYDPLNEPYPANNVRDPTLYIPGVMDRKHLQPTYANIFDKYIKNDKKAIQWFEPVTNPDVNGWLDGGTIFPVGFDVPPGADIGSKNHVLNDHTYCC